MLAGSSHALRQGHRAYQEDRVVSDTRGDWDALFVLDGHGGSAAVDYVAEHLCPRLLAAVATAGPLEATAGPLEATAGPLEAASLLITGVFSELDQSMTQLATCCGTTVAGVLRGPHGAFLINLGDSLISLHDGVSREVLWTSRPHRPDDPDEKTRIEAAGGFLTSFIPGGIRRVNGVMGVTRALGDFLMDLKTGSPNSPLSCVPEITFRPGPLPCVVLVTDGVADLFASTAEVAAFLGSALLAATPSSDPASAILAACETHAPEAINIDNATVCVLMPTA